MCDKCRQMITGKFIALESGELLCDKCSMENEIKMLQRENGLYEKALRDITQVGRIDLNNWRYRSEYHAKCMNIAREALGEN